MEIAEVDPEWEKVFQISSKLRFALPVQSCEDEIWIGRGRFILGASTPLSDPRSQTNLQVKEYSYEKSDSVNRQDRNRQTIESPIALAVSQWFESSGSFSCFDAIALNGNKRSCR